MSTSNRWDAASYEQYAAFVPELGAAALQLLAPRPGELIVDIGCGNGALTQKIVEAGAQAVGLDSSPEMVEAARARGVDAFVADAEALGLEEQARRFGQFDAAFSNAALHWMPRPDAVAAGVYGMLKPGGRFVGEMGGAGNLAILRQSVRDELIERGYPVPGSDSQWYPALDEFIQIYGNAGFVDIRAELVERPTALPTGIADWVRTFRARLLDAAQVPDGERDAVAQAIERRVAPQLGRPDGRFEADYVRLRFWMRKPD